MRLPFILREKEGSEFSFGTGPYAGYGPLAVLQVLRRTVRRSAASLFRGVALASFRRLLMTPRGMNDTHDCIRARVVASHGSGREALSPEIGRVLLPRVPRAATQVAAARNG